VILPLTGNYAVIGEGEKKGIDMAVETLKQKFPGKKIEIIYEDYASETKNAVTAANKLISVDKVDAIITSTTAASEAVSPVVERAQKINFVISPDIEVVSKSQYNFRIYYNFNTEAEVVNAFDSEL
jgi:branched-chain amino acid transport system substrate-binding protein